MADELQNNELNANQEIENEEVIQEPELVQPETSEESPIADEKEGKEEIKTDIEEKEDPIQQLKEDIDAKFNQFYQLIGVGTQPYQNQPQQYSPPIQTNPEEQKELERYRKFRELEKIEEEKARLNKCLQENTAKARQKYKDFDKKVYNNPELLKLNENTVNLIISEADGLDVAYELVTKQPEKFEQMKTMSPAKQILEFAKLQTNLENKNKQHGNPTEKKEIPEPLTLMKNSGKVEKGDLQAQIKKNFRKDFVNNKT